MAKININKTNQAKTEIILQQIQCFTNYYLNEQICIDT